MKKVTEPMKVILINAQLNKGEVWNVYPRGQMRLIIQGLYNRGLIDDPNTHGKWELTEAGWAYK
jgi:hypothetical protein